MSRRIISVALPWLQAEHRLRAEGQSGLTTPFAVVEHAQGTARLAGVNQAAAMAGLSAGQALTDARAIYPDLATKPASPERLTTFQAALTRWAEQFSPLTGTDHGNALVMDATGCTHLFGGEQAMLDALTQSLAEHGLTGRAAMADTKGAAWALAHSNGPRIAATGQTRHAIADLPVASLRLPDGIADALAKTGLTTIEPLTRMPRGALARRFGIEAMRRLDQALGTEPEPVAPARAQPSFSARLTLPDPIGLTKDVMAGLDRLLERLCRDLEIHQMGARTLRLTVRRVDGADQSAEISLARAGRDPMRLRELFAPKVDDMKAGFGIDALHLTATATEPLKPAQLTQAHRETEAARLADLLSRIGNRVGFDNVIRFLPAESHIPERAFTAAAAAHSDPETWHPTGRPPRPIQLFRPEGIAGQPSAADPPAHQGPGSGRAMTESGVCGV